MHGTNRLRLAATSLLVLVFAVLGTSCQSMRQETVEKEQDSLARETGLIPPEPQEMMRRLQSQDVIAARIAQIAASVKSPTTRPAVQLGTFENVPLPSRFDWSALGKVTDARDQQRCGSCWDFAAVAALEASYLIRQGGSPSSVDASEQCVLDCVPSYSCKGGWWDEPFNLMMKRGLPAEADYPYSSRKGTCLLDRPRAPAIKYRAVNWGYVDRDKTFIPKNEDIKRALLAHGPLAVGFTNSRAFTIWGNSGAKGVFKTHSPDPVNHGIVIVGWDDEMGDGAWKIKNSWKAWGINGEGFAWVGYGVNNIGFNAAWVDAASAGAPIFHNATYLSTIKAEP